METEDIKSIWHSNDSLLERSLRLNILCVEKIQSQRSKSKLRPLLIFRIMEALIQLKVILLLCNFLNSNMSEAEFVIPVALLLIFWLVAFYMCLSQIFILIQISFSQSVIAIQEKLARLQTHILDYFRLTFLMIPLWIAYPVVGFKMFADINILNFGDSTWWTANIVFCILTIPVCAWLFIQVSYKNINKRWVRFFIRNAGGESVTKAMEFLKEINDFRKVS